MPSIGSHIRALRERRELSLSDLARKSGFSKGFISKIENGHAQPPIATLMRLASALGCELGELFDGPRPTGAPASVLTRREDREHVEPSEERAYAFERLGIGSPFRLTPYIIHLNRDQDAPPSYQHAGEEMIFVLSGEMNYAAGGRLHRLRKGDTLLFDATLPHGPIKLPGKNASYLAVFAGESVLSSAKRKRIAKKRMVS